MMKGALKIFVVSLAVSVLAGCGSSMAGTSPISTAGLNGNWLVTGDLPVFPVGQPSSQNFGLAMTLDVINGQVVATSSDFYPCSGSAVGGSGGLAPATVASDGSFTLQTLQINGVVPTVALSVHGNVSQTAGGSWFGTYSATNSNAGCTPVGGTFTAVPIQAVTGTFHGTGSLGAPTSTTPTPITLTATLTQGGPASLDPPVEGSPVNSVSALSGTISISGSTCFSNGTAKIPSGSVFGNRLDAQFAMDDGSMLLLTGTVKDTTSSTIVLTSILVNGGACNGFFGSSGSILTRQ
jgi:hypothetical protein